MSTQTPPVPMSAKTLGTLFEFTYNVFKQNTAGITHEESLRSPQPGGNCMNWVAGHLVGTRQALLEMLGQTSTWTAAERERYKRGSAPITNPAEAIPWDRLVRDLDASQEKLRPALAALTPQQLAAALPPEKNTFKLDSVGDQLAVLHFHESYHVGQLGILRRIYGKQGAIA